MVGLIRRATSSTCRPTFSSGNVTANSCADPTPARVSNSGSRASPQKTRFRQAVIALALAGFSSTMQ